MGITAPKFPTFSDKDISTSRCWENLSHERFISSSGKQKYGSVLLYWSLLK